MMNILSLKKNAQYLRNSINQTDINCVVMEKYPHIADIQILCGIMNVNRQKQ